MMMDVENVSNKIDGINILNFDATIDDNYGATPKYIDDKDDW